MAKFLSLIFLALVFSCSYKRDNFELLFSSSSYKYYTEDSFSKEKCDIYYDKPNYVIKLIYPQRITNKEYYAQFDTLSFYKGSKPHSPLGKLIVCKKLTDSIQETWLYSIENDSSLRVESCVHKVDGGGIFRYYKTFKK